MHVIADDGDDYTVVVVAVVVIRQGCETRCHETYGVYPTYPANPTSLYCTYILRTVPRVCIQGRYHGWCTSTGILKRLCASYLFVFSALTDMTTSILI